MFRRALLGAALVIGVSLTAPVAPAVHAQGGQSNIHAIISEFCTANGDFGLSHGGCVSYYESIALNTPGLGSSAWITNFCQQFGPPTIGRCVSFWNQVLKTP